MAKQPQKSLVYGAPLPKCSGALPVVCKDEAAWLRERKKHLTASNFAAVTRPRCSPYQTQLQVWVDKRDADFEIEQTPAMAMGKKREPEIREWYAREYGKRVWHKEYTIWVSNQHKMFGGSVDGLVPEEHILFEAKTTREKTSAWGDPWSDQIPQMYIVQVQALMMVLGKEYKRAHVVVLFKADDSYVCYEIQRSEKIIKQLIKDGRAFWKTVTNKKAKPPIAESDAPSESDAVASLFGVPIKDDMPVADMEVKALMDKVLIAADDYKASETELETLKNQLKQHIGEHEGLRHPNGIDFWTWKQQPGKSGVDNDRLRADGLYEKYAKQGKPYRQLNHFPRRKK